MDFMMESIIIVLNQDLGKKRGILMIKTNNLLKKTGFYQTLEILSSQPVRLGVFYRELNKESYWNAFSRIKQEMLNHGIIEIYRNYNTPRMIKLTRKGVEIKQALQRLIEVIG